eukprot:688443-Rhodomonas_salina.2
MKPASVGGMERGMERGQKERARAEHTPSSRAGLARKTLVSATVRCFGVAPLGNEVPTCPRAYQRSSIRCEV